MKKFLKGLGLAVVALLVITIVVEGFYFPRYLFGMKKIETKEFDKERMDGTTYRAWGTKLTNERIDYCLVSKTKIEVEKYAVLQNAYNGVYPSDHFPIYMRIKIK